LNKTGKSKQEIKKDLCAASTQYLLAYQNSSCVGRVFTMLFMAAAALGASEKLLKIDKMPPFLPPVNTMSQLTFAEAEYAIKKRTTRREKFLAQLEQLVPWQKLNQQLSKGYKKTGPGRPPYPLETMLRIHIM
jgi:IS5 family transposase